MEAHYNDLTGISWAMIRVADHATYDANEAMLANMTSGAPASTFVHNGATWEIGRIWKEQNQFCLYDTLRSTASDLARGMGVSYRAEPYLCVNMAERKLTAGEIGGYYSAGRGALLAQPEVDGSPSVIRFTAPMNGVYTAIGWFKDVGVYGWNHNDGIKAMILVNDVCGASNVINGDDLQNPVGSVRVSSRYLRIGEKVTFVVDPNGTFDCDLTAFHACVIPQEGPVGRHVNFDFDGYDGDETPSTYVGTGTIGWSGERWNSIRLHHGDTAMATSAIFADEGEDGVPRDTMVKLEIGHECGFQSATAADVDGGTSAPALFGDGIVSTGPSDAYSFTVSCLMKNATYEFIFYSRSATGTAGEFTIGEASVVSDGKWQAAEGGDYAKITVTANALGCVSGTFSSVAEANAVWCGLQIRGEAFKKFKGFSVIVR